MVHHVAIEIAPDQMAAERDFWLATGFIPVPVPESLGSGFAWFEREGTQIHLMETADPSAPPRSGHVAIVAPDFDAALERLADAGFEATEGRQHWGARRAKVKTPAGHSVELMAAPPAPATPGFE